jgi:eukaryotic-like serine/threonine-protein kinase
METLATLQNAIDSRYRLERELGSGGMARVYLAKDRDRDCYVAVKILRQELGVLLGASRFHREIDILTRLHHPHILPLLDSSETGTRLYYVMPYVEGDSLDRRLHHEGPQSLDAMMALAQDVAAAIDYAHSMEVIHRDIKPGNILIDGDSSLVCDFGIARAIEAAGGESLSSSGLAFGTPLYMSPEQAMGQQVTAQTDVYSLGCVIYEMLSGEPPFTGPTSQAVIARIITDDLRPLRTTRPDIPQRVEDGIRWALAKIPDERPASAGALVRHLAG